MRRKTPLILAFLLGQVMSLVSGSSGFPMFPEMMSCLWGPALAAQEFAQLALRVEGMR